VLLDHFEADWVTQGSSPRTVAEYIRILRKFGFVEHPPTIEQARAHILLRQKDGVTDQTVLAEVRALKAYSRWWANTMKRSDPLEALPFPKVSASPPGPIATTKDINTLLRAFEPTKVIDRTARTHHYDAPFEMLRVRCIVVMLRDTGARRGELANLKLSDIDMVQRMILFRDTKNGDSRKVPMSRHLHLELYRYLEVRKDHPHAAMKNVFIGTQGALQPRGIAHVLEQACAKAGVRISCHQFRRRFSYEWAKNQGHDDTLRLIAGWKDDRMPSRYRQELARELAFEELKRIVG